MAIRFFRSLVIRQSIDSSESAAKLRWSSSQHKFAVEPRIPLYASRKGRYIARNVWNAPRNMNNLSEKLSSLAEYAGIRSRNYFQATTIPTYDPGDPMAYYLDESARASYDHLDATGLPLYVEEGPPIYLPVFLCFYALGQLQLYRNQSSDASRVQFLRVADWLAKNQDQNGVWLSPLPSPKFGLTRPYPSAMTQGLAISCLCRAARLTGDSSYRRSAEAALTIFHRDVREGGVTSHDKGQIFFEEYPSFPYHHVLNGFLYAMWGLLDLKRMGDEDAARLYDQGFATFVDWLPRFDMGFWSRYHLSEGPDNPATLHYQRLHVDQLEVMAQISGHPTVIQYRDTWNSYLASRWNPLRTLPAKLRWTLFYKARINS
jgi:heparosan-N-sulfate-glucuronate 5-epimerase